MHLRLGWNIAHLLKAHRYEGSRISAEPEVVSLLRDTLLYSDIHELPKNKTHKTLSPSLSSSALPVVLFFSSLCVLSAVVFHSSRSIQLQGLVAICQKNYTSSKLCGKFLLWGYSTGGGDESGLFKRHTRLSLSLSLSPSPPLCLSPAGRSLSLTVVPVAQV